jgi:hypothetical protein
LSCLRQEVPLKDSEPFQIFVESIAQHATCTNPHKRKRPADISNYEIGSQETLKEDERQQQIQLIERSKRKKREHHTIGN